MPLSTGEVINTRYRIVALLGQGGFGAVYKAWDLNLKVPCALKENLETDPASVRQFEREASLLAVLRHPSLPRVTDHFILPERGQYLVMDFIEGRDLQSILDSTQAPLPESQVVGWLSEILDALEYLHTQEIPVIHRDIKPANIKITPAGRAVLVDFGIAKEYNPSLPTTQGARAVTPGYSPFEQYGQAPTDARTDIYALGATAYALLTGRPPAESIARMAGALLDPPQQINPSVSPDVEQAILKALELMPANRFLSAAAFKQALLGKPAPGGETIPDSFQPAGPARLQTAGAPPGMQQNAPASVSAVAPTARASTPRSKPAAPPTRRSSRGWIIGGVLVAGLIVLALAIAVIAPKFGAASPMLTQAVAGLPDPSTPTRNRPTSPPPTEPPTPLPVSTDTPALPALPAVDTLPAPTNPFKACLVTDAGGIDDRSFNATAWLGVEIAMAKFGISGEFLESPDGNYLTAIETFIKKDCGIIITVGFLQGDATKTAAESSPDRKFSIVDFAYEPAIPNVLGQVFATEQAAFQAGYLAAGVTKSGMVGTFGGLQIPTVTAFMDGFALGVQYYNEVHGMDVKVLGWDPQAQTGMFTGNFYNTDDGRTLGVNLMDQGADIILPVAGPVGLGTAAAAQERGSVYIIGVDSDWYETAPEYKDVILTSVMKFSHVTTFNAIEAALNGVFQGGTVEGNLGNGGVGLAPFHELEFLVSPELRQELEKIVPQIVAGTLKTIPQK